MKFISLSIFQSLKLRILIEKFILISPKLKFSANTLGCYGLTQPYLTLKLGYVCGNPDLNEHRGKVFEEVDRESSPLRNSLTDCSSYCHFLWTLSFFLVQPQFRHPPPGCLLSGARGPERRDSPKWDSCCVLMNDRSARRGPCRAAPTRLGPSPTRLGPRGTHALGATDRKD